MTSLPVLYRGQEHKKRLRLHRSFRYIGLALLAVAFISTLVVLYLGRAPVYSSGLSIVLPGSGSSSSFNIENVGAASQQTKTPFGSMAFSPLVNYKEILKSREVLRGAAERLRISLELLKAPRVELRERTSILNIYVEGVSPEAAHTYGWAVYDAFQEALDNLREDEILRRDDSVRSALEMYRLRLAQTRQAIVEFQQRALLISTEQVGGLMNTISGVAEKKMSAESLARNTEDYVRQLGIDLGVSPSLAGQAFRLQSDAEFRGYLKEMDSSAMKVAEYSSLWGKNHPKVISQNLRYEGAQASLRTRSAKIVGVSASELLHAVDLQSSPQRAELFATLVSEFAKLQGLKAEIGELTISESRLRDTLKVYSRESAELERLEREHSLAEAVFTTAAARLEASRADIFASYPAVQILSVPSVPSKPKSPNKGMAIAVGVMGTVFVLFGLFTGWHRNYLIDLILKNS